MNRFLEMMKLSQRVFTKKSRLLPNFIIIGTPRAGTTSLYQYLISHPNVLSAVKKETVFFNYAYHVNLDWYRMYFPTKRECERIKNKRGHQILITGEATPSYLIDPRIPKRIFEKLPKIKLIILLRNPVDRALSHYHLNVSLGIESLSFEEAINQEPLRINKSFEEIKNDKSVYDDNAASYFLRLLKFQPQNYFNFSYLNSGKYYEHLKNWTRFFPENQLLILKSEDFFNDPKSYFKQVQDFLDLPYFDLGGYYRHFEIKYPTMNDNLRKSLIKKFQPHNEKLYKFLNKDFEWK